MKHHRFKWTSVDGVLTRYYRKTPHDTPGPTVTGILEKTATVLAPAVLQIATGQQLQTEKLVDDFKEIFSPPTSSGISTSTRAIPIGIDINRIRQTLEKKKVELHEKTLEAQYGQPLGALRSELASWIKMIDLELVVEDERFQNFRLTFDPESLANLQESIKIEGLKIPIAVIRAPDDIHYFVRAGFRRTIAIRNLQWKQIPAIILPGDTPEKEEYWLNIIENASREQLKPYELANAAKIMRDKFGIKVTEFAQRSGVSESYVYQLLRCLDNLPPLIIDDWKNGKRVPLEILSKFALLRHHEALSSYHKYLGNTPLRHEDFQKGRIEKPTKPSKPFTAYGMIRSQRLMTAIQIATNLSPRTKELLSQIVEYCQGCRNTIPGVFEPKQQKKQEENMSIPFEKNFK